MSRYFAYLDDGVDVEADNEKEAFKLARMKFSELLNSDEPICMTIESDDD